MINSSQLEMIASAGALRRARKSLDKAPLTWLEIDDASRKFEFDGHQGVIFLEHIETSQCSCPATGVCKHIVAAALVHLDDEPSVSYAPPVFELPELIRESGKLAGRYVWKQWNSRWEKLFDSQQSPDPVPTEQLIPKDLDFERREDHCQLAWEEYRAVIGDGNGIAAVVLEQGGNQYKLLAALLYMACMRQEIHWPDWLRQEDITKQQSEEEKLNSCQADLKWEVVKLCGHGSRNIRSDNLIELLAMVPRLKTAGAKSMANSVLALAEQVERRESDKGLDPSTRIFKQLVELYAQCESTHMVDKARDSEVVDLHLLCLGGISWLSENGALGLTMLFLSADGNLHKASVSRSQPGGGFSVNNTWQNTALWQGAPLNQLMPGKQILLKHASVNQWGSLSLSQKTICEPIENKEFGLVAIDDWQQLKNIDEYGYALLSVKRWLACDFLESSQQLVMQLEDQKGQLLLVKQRYSAEFKDRIANLQTVWEQQPDYLVVRHIRESSEHIFEPVIIHHKRWVSLDFEEAPKHRRSLLNRFLARMAAKGDSPAEIGDDLSALFEHTVKVLSEYPAIAKEELQGIAERLKALGLNAMSEITNDVNFTSEQCLRLAYMASSLSRLNAKWPIIVESPCNDHES
ncbi:hypothetical protein ACVBEJ_01765 [Porticoccus sp. GXU_MW_L64]